MEYKTTQWNFYYIATLIINKAWNRTNRRLNQKPSVRNIPSKQLVVRVPILNYNKIVCIIDPLKEKAPLMGLHNKIPTKY